MLHSFAARPLFWLDREGRGTYNKDKYNETERRAMLTGELKNKVDSLWEIFWTGALATDERDVLDLVCFVNLH